MSGRGVEAGKARRSEKGEREDRRMSDEGREFLTLINEHRIRDGHGYGDYKDRGGAGNADGDRDGHMRTQAETETETATEMQTATETETKAETETKTETETVAETEAETETVADTETDTEAETKPRQGQRR